MTGAAARADTYDLEPLQVLHAAVPGRVRLACPSLYRARRRMVLLEERLQRYTSITAVSGNTLRGSLLIRFSSEQDAEGITRLVLVELARLSDRPVDLEADQAGDPSPDDPVTAVSRPPLSSPRKVSVPGAAGLPERPPGEAARARAPGPPAVLRKTDRAWHAQSFEEVCRTLASHSSEGLSAAAANQRLTDHGPNLLPQPTGRSDYELFVSQLWNGPVAMLAGAAVLSVATGGLVDAAAIGAVILINATIGFVTERQSERIIEGLHRPDEGTAHVVREGALQQMPAAALVPGDLIRLAGGDGVPADVRLVAVDRLKVNESLLTGESAPVTKSAEVIQSERALADRINMAYRDSRVVSGSGSGIVVATGAETEVGRVHELIGVARPPDTPMQIQLDRIGSQLVWLSAGICVGIFALGWLRGYGLTAMLNRAVSLAVAALPEGLPTVATTTLALGVRQMRDQRALVRNLSAVETLGACSVACLDKTGTLTENRLRAVEVQILDQAFPLEDGAMDHPTSETFQLLGRTLALCVENGHDSGGNGGSNGGSEAGFSPTETALVELARRSVGDPDALRLRHPLLDIEHRADHRPYLITRHRLNGGTLTSAKGSPERLLALCGTVMTRSGPVPLDDQRRERILQQNQRMAGQSLRVLAAAYAFEPGPGGAPADLTWIGLVGLADPLREGARALMEQLHRAGVQTVMLTGDQAPTARAIARRLNLSNGDTLRVVDAQHLAQAKDLESVHAFSRVAPGQKSEIVAAFQRAGKVVAMTGDGVNDGPALKAADIGIALGADGTETARLAADVVLEDDNLETLLFSVRQGRTIYANIRKSIHYLLATNLSEIEVMLASVAFNLGQPLSPMQLLWINLVTDIFPGLALAMEAPEPDVLDRPPRDPRRPIIGPRDFRRLAVESTTISAGAISSYLYGISRYGAGPRAGGLCFLTLVLGQLLHTWSCRSDQPVVGHDLAPNRYVGMAVGGALGLQTVAALVPPFRRLLGIPAVGAMDALVILAGALAPLVVNETSKRLLSPGPDPSAAPR